MTVTLHNIPQGTEQWHADRDDKYTGSNAYKLLGMFGASEYARAKQTGFGGNFYTKRGHRLEDQAIQLYERIYRTTVARPGYVTNSKYPSSLYSPDGIDVQEDRAILDIEENDTLTLARLPGVYLLLEVKSFVGKSYDRIFDHGPDLKILAQVHYGFFVTGLRHGRLIIYNPRYAKKFFEDEHGVQTPNPEYSPARAIKVFDINYDSAINNNFKRILAPKEGNYA